MKNLKSSKGKEIIKSEKRKASLKFVLVVPLDSISFNTEDSAKMWKFVVNRRIGVQKDILEQA